MTALLGGHTDTVNAVKFLATPIGLFIISGSVDKTVRVWKRTSRYDSGDVFECVQVLEEHKSSVNCITAVNGTAVFATGAADASVKVWELNENVSDGSLVTLVQDISIKPRFFPLALALSPLGGSDNSFILAVAGTTTIIQLYVTDTESTPDFRLRATLAGHEGWIRSLAFTNESTDINSDLLLSSASLDKYIRLWRIHQGNDVPAAAAQKDPALGAFMPGKSLSNKAHRFTAFGEDFTATFEALLLGHDDWIYSTRWNPTSVNLQLLSASADNSLAIWEQDTNSGVWVSVARMGEISSQKGSTTATGSTGGFWTGLFSSDGNTVVCLGRTGSWRLWNYSTITGDWVPGVGISGHTAAITGISWAPSGSYLLTTSSDQTTRLHTNWLQSSSPGKSSQETWHEVARPQIHGYDLNCISALTPTTFVSGADEKLLRVFSLPSTVATLISTISKTPISALTSELHPLSEAANMPVLGLSNKAISAMDDDVETSTAAPNHQDRDAVDPANAIKKSTLIMNHPPLEDHLSRATLFPEIEKLYGHGYEISCLATSPDGSVVATACKASSIDHAVIRLFETKKWTQAETVLQAHALTVTRLRFSSDGTRLLSVGRDRMWVVWECKNKDEQRWEEVQRDPKGHARMILDCAWLPGSSSTFATAGRDKSVKLWKVDEDGKKPTCVETIAEESPVTAIDVELENRKDGTAYLAVGTEAGRVIVYQVDLKGLKVTAKSIIDSRYVRSAESQILPRSNIGQDLAVEGYHTVVMASSHQGIRGGASVNFGCTIGCSQRRQLVATLQDRRLIEQFQGRC